MTIALPGEICRKDPERRRSMLPHLLRHLRQDHKVEERQDKDHHHPVEDRQLVMSPDVSEAMQDGVLS
jgi:imidazoleglycerol phosphate dehydratase HisB